MCFCIGLSLPPPSHSFWGGYMFLSRQLLIGSFASGWFGYGYDWRLVCLPSDIYELLVSSGLCHHTLVWSRRASNERLQSLVGLIFDPHLLGDGPESQSYSKFDLASQHFQICFVSTLAQLHLRSRRPLTHAEQQFEIQTCLQFMSEDLRSSNFCRKTQGW